MSLWHLKGSDSLRHGKFVDPGCLSHYCVLPTCTITKTKNKGRKNGHINNQRHNKSTFTLIKHIKGFFSIDLDLLKSLQPLSTLPYAENYDQSFTA